MTDNVRNEVTILVSHHATGVEKIFTFPSSLTIQDVIKIVSTSFYIPNFEAYGLCYPDAEKSKQKGFKGISSTRSKVGDFRDTTEWLTEFKTLQQCGIKDEDELVLKVKHDLLSHQAVQEINVLIPSERMERKFKYTYTTTVKEAIDSIVNDLCSGVHEATLMKDLRRWRMFLPLRKAADGKYEGIWLDGSRTFISYDLYSNQKSGVTDADRKPKLRTVILCTKLEEKNTDLKNTTEGATEMFDVTTAKWMTKLPNLLQFKQRNHKKFKSMVRRGIPDSLRGDVWQILTGSRDEMFKAPDIYTMSLGAQIHPEVLSRIKTDISRTFPSHPFFNETGQRALCNVLSAYSVVNPKVGYCQGMNFLVGILLLTMNEESAFWTLDVLMKKYDLENFFLPDVPNLNASLLQYSALIETLFPEIWTHFRNEGVDVSMFAPPWFHTLFARDSQLSFVFRLWDIFLNEGISIIFRVALAILRESQGILLKMDQVALVQYLKGVPQQIRNPDLILNAALKIPKNKWMIKVYSLEELEKEGISKDSTKRTPLNIEKKSQPRMKNVLSTRRLKAPKETHTSSDELMSPHAVHRPRSHSDSSHNDAHQQDNESSSAATVAALPLTPKTKRETPSKQKKNVSSPRLQFLDNSSPEPTEETKLKDRKEDKENKTKPPESRSEAATVRHDDNENKSQKKEKERDIQTNPLKELSKENEALDLNQITKDNQKRVSPYKRQAIDRQNTRLTKTKSKDEIITRNITENHTTNETSSISSPKKDSLQHSRSVPFLSQLSNASSPVLSSSPNSSSIHSLPPPAFPSPDVTQQLPVNPILPPPPPPLVFAATTPAQISGPKVAPISSKLPSPAKPPQRILAPATEKAPQETIKDSISSPKIESIAKIKSGIATRQQLQALPKSRPQTIQSGSAPTPPSPLSLLSFAQTTSNPRPSAILPSSPTTANRKVVQQGKNSSVPSYEQALSIKETKLSKLDELEKRVPLSSSPKKEHQTSMTTQSPSDDNVKKLTADTSPEPPLSLRDELSKITATPSRRVPQTSHTQK
jgi:hypothetical protein